MYFFQADLLLGCFQWMNEKTTYGRKKTANTSLPLSMKKDETLGWTYSCWVSVAELIFHICVNVN